MLMLMLLMLAMQASLMVLAETLPFHVIPALAVLRGG
jgi:hypothetical protein